MGGDFNSFIDSELDAQGGGFVLKISFNKCTKLVSRTPLCLTCLTCLLAFVPYVPSFFSLALCALSFLLRALIAVILLCPFCAFAFFIKCGTTHKQPQLARINKNEIELTKNSLN